MKIRELLKLKERYLPGGARSVAADRAQTTVTPVQARNRIVRREPLWSQDISSDADPNDGVNRGPFDRSRPTTDKPRTDFHATHPRS
jgi:hypothetical protein